jgi:1-deoxy-D-xylulose-5-phosphate reductoisomerase
MPKGLAILGSTGSIGRQTLEVVEAFPDRFEIISLAARHNFELLEQQVQKFKPRIVTVFDNDAAARLRSRLGKTRTAVYSDEEGLIKAATAHDVDLMVMAIVGVEGLKPTLEAISKGKNIALASKEILVAAGEIVKGEAEKRRVTIFPIDSEHSAIFQCLRGENVNKIDKIILTASGGPFWDKTDKDFSSISPQEALSHPNWKMGSKITVDSATMMNKGLEIIEARWLFDVGFDKIDVVIHPQSIVHSMVRFTDGSVIAQMSLPDMRLPIQYALTFPDRLESRWPALDLTQLEKLTFFKPDMERFPCLAMAFEAGKRGATAPAVLNAANEEAVRLFLEEKISFAEIPSLVKETLLKHKVIDNPALNDILKADEWARKYVAEKRE